MYVTAEFAQTVHFFWNRKNKLFSLTDLSPKPRFSRSISYSTLIVENPNKKSFEIIFFLEVVSWGVGSKSGNFPDFQWVSLVNLHRFTKETYWKSGKFLLFDPTPNFRPLRKNIIPKDFLFGFSTVNVEYDILLEKRGFGGRSVREKSLFFRFQKKMYSFDKKMDIIVSCYVHRPLSQQLT